VADLVLEHRQQIHPVLLALIPALGELGVVPRGVVHRLLGDSDGDRDVDWQDRGRFGSAFGTRAADSGYLWYFDFDGDGDVDGRDNGQFNRRFG
jgi:hypothetical protein